MLALDILAVQSSLVVTKFKLSDANDMVAEKRGLFRDNVFTECMCIRSWKTMDK